MSINYQCRVFPDGTGVFQIVLDGFANVFSYLKKGLGLILIFIGLKMLIAPIFHISALVSLGILGALLLGSILISIWKKKGLIR